MIQKLKGLNSEIHWGSLMLIHLKIPREIRMPMGTSSEIHLEILRLTLMDSRWEILMHSEKVMDFLIAILKVILKH